jgi:biopolymer transport protein ExbB
VRKLLSMHEIPQPFLRSPRRTALFVLLSAFVIMNYWSAAAPVVLAFQDENAAKQADADPPVEVDDANDGERESFLMLVISASGVYGLLLLICSFIMVAVIVMNILQVRRDVLMPPDFIDEFEQKLTAEDYQGAYEAARADESFLARVLATGMGRLNRGYAAAVEGMQETGEDETMVLEHRLSYLALIASVAPMLGLMGTVHGMIISFSEIAEATTSPKPRDLAFGIERALFTTLEGMIIAIPAMISYSLFKNRLSRFVLEIGIISEGLMGRFANVGKSAAKPAATVAKPGETGSPS